MLQGDSLGYPAAEAGAEDVVCIDRATLREIVRRARGLDRLAAALLAAAPEGEGEGGAVLPDRAPKALIQSPENGSVIASGANIVLSVDISDPEDLYFNKSTVTWSSSLDGGLGNGPIRNATLDTVGVHIITVNVVDSAGNTTVATATVTVN